MFSHPPTDNGDRQLQQRLEISGFLFVAHAKLAVVVHPRMGPLHDPAACFALAAMPLLGQSLGGHMRDISADAHFFFRGFSRVALVHTQMLRPFTGRFRPSHHDHVQRLGQQFHVVPIGSGDDKRERGATTVHQQAALGAFFFPDPSGCYPRLLAPAALCLGCHPNFAIPTQCPPFRHTPPTPLATSARTIPSVASAESADEWRWHCRTPRATPSIDNPCATQRKSRRKWLAARSICVRRRASVGIFVCAPPAVRGPAAAVQRETKARCKLPMIARLAWMKHGKISKIRQLLFTDKLLIVIAAFLVWLVDVLTVLLVVAGRW